MADRATNPQQSGITEHCDAESSRVRSCLLTQKSENAGIACHWLLHEILAFPIPGLSRISRIRGEVAA